MPCSQAADGCWVVTSYASLEAAQERWRARGLLSGKRLNVERMKAGLAERFPPPAHRSRDRPTSYSEPSHSVVPAAPRASKDRLRENPAPRLHVHEFMETAAFVGWSVRAGGTRGLVWTLKGTLPDGRGGYLMGEASSHKDALLTAAEALARGNWRIDKFPHLR